MILWPPPDNQALACTPPIINLSGARSRELLRAVLAQFELERWPRYRAGLLNGKPDSRARSWCNLAAVDICAALGVPLPRMLKGRYLTANDMFDWLAGDGQLQGWEPTTVQTSVRLVEEGRPVLAVWRHPIPTSSGHIAVGAPAPDDMKPGGLYIAQAGSRNFTCGTLKSGFGDRPVKVYTRG